MVSLVLHLQGGASSLPPARPSSCAPSDPDSLSSLQFSERATTESAELKMRLERERREARRLTGQLAADREHQARLEDSLEAVEQAREQSLEECVPPFGVLSFVRPS